MSKTMARKRLAKNRDLEPHVKECRGYYTYQHPAMKARGIKAQSFGRNKELANETARLVNAELAGASDYAASILSALDPAPRESLGEVIDLFKTGYLKVADWSEGYRDEVFMRLDKIRRVAGGRPFADLDVKAVKELIFGNFEGDGIRLARLTLIHLWRFAIGEGYSDKLAHNYPEMVNAPKQAPRRRARIKDMKEYREMRAACPDWLQDAMDIALITLQRRADIVSIDHRRDIVKRDGQEILRVVSKKTGYAVEIPIGENLRPVIRRCQTRAMRLGSPFLICKTFRTGGGRPGSNKAHRAQVLPAYLSRQFKACTGGQFHEIRSLGRREYERILRAQGQGDDAIKGYIKALGGWDDDKMYDLYGETGEVKYTLAQAGLKVQPASDK